MTKNNSKRGFGRKQLLLFGALILIGGLVVLFLEKRQIIDLYSKEPTAVNPSDAKTTSSAPTAQEDFTGGDERLIPENKKNEGTVQDTGGTASNNVDDSLWTNSADNMITVYSPAKNALVTNGSVLSGESKLPKVYFRLIDDVSGVISRGSLNVVNGKFSGTFDFSTTGTNGRLDIFNSASDGVESSNVEIPVRFK